MLRLRIRYQRAAELRRAVDEELARGVLLVRITPPADLEFRATVELAVVTSQGSIDLTTSVESILPGVGVVVAFPAAKLAEAREMLAELKDGAGAGGESHEIVTDEAAAAPAAGRQGGAGGGGQASKIHLAMFGTRDDRAAILRDQNRALHPYVLKSPHVTVDEITGWAKNPQMTADFLKQIADRKEWLSRPLIALALARNPKTPTDVAVRALDFVGLEAVRQIAKNQTAPPGVVQAARKKIVGK